jgi:hypothetical protein
MSQHGFLNDNEYRSYPFITPAYRPDADVLPDPVALSERLIVDCGIILGLSAGGYDPNNADVVYRVYLHSLSRSGTTLTFTFRSDAPGTAGFPLTFTREITDTEFLSSFSGSLAAEASESSDSLDCRDEPVWEGYLVTGDLSQHGLADGETVVFEDEDWQVEPALVQNLSYLRSITLANYDRTHYMPDEECCSSCSVEPQAIYINAFCLDGPLRFREGYNVSIRQEDAARRIVIGAAVGSGAGQGCDMPQLYPGEVPPDDSRVLGGGPACDELIVTINGSGGRVVTINPGPGFIIVPDPENHTLRITASFSQFAGGPCDESSDSVGA